MSEAEFRMLVHQVQHRSKGVVDHLEGLWITPQPHQVDVRVAQQADAVFLESADALLDPGHDSGQHVGRLFRAAAAQQRQQLRVRGLQIGLRKIRERPAELFAVKIIFDLCVMHLQTRLQQLGLSGIDLNLQEMGSAFRSLRMEEQIAGIAAEAGYKRPAIRSHLSPGVADIRHDRHPTTAQNVRQMHGSFKCSCPSAAPAFKPPGLKPGVHQVKR
ncbi:MAG: hypothetical protein BWY83_02606 [bacterium ADurb.Bin478]|nr:MAG: hypothetical protein BWY83_02606 [bacterium ADurb.Bin478]